jgi:hypothetical protein
MKEGNPVTQLFFTFSEKKFNLSGLGDLRPIFGLNFTNWLGYFSLN